jgi:hypothetical protein
MGKEQNQARKYNFYPFKIGERISFSRHDFEVYRHITPYIL